jgi:hypothetical protein
MSTTVTIAAQQPDISYHPDIEKYKLRTERLKAERSSNIGLPTGFPAQLSGPLVWEAKDFGDETPWDFVLTKAQLNEIHDAFLHFKGGYNEMKPTIHFPVNH